MNQGTAYANSSSPLVIILLVLFRCEKAPLQVLFSNGCSSLSISLFLFQVVKLSGRVSSAYRAARTSLHGSVDPLSREHPPDRQGLP